MRPNILINLSRNLTPLFPDLRTIFVFTPGIMMELEKSSAIDRRSITISGTTPGKLRKFLTAKIEFDSDEHWIYVKNR